jgi:hypothetical protein
MFIEYTTCMKENSMHEDHKMITWMGLHFIGKNDHYSCLFI